MAQNKNNPKIIEEQLEPSAYPQQITLGIISEFINCKEENDINKFLNKKRHFPDEAKKEDDVKNELKKEDKKPKKKLKKRNLRKRRLKIIIEL